MLLILCLILCCVLPYSIYKCSEGAVCGMHECYSLITTCKESLDSTVGIRDDALSLAPTPPNTRGNVSARCSSAT